MGTKAKLGSGWEEITTSDEFTVQVLSRQPGEFIRSAAGVPASTVDGVEINQHLAINPDNLTGTGTLYGRTSGGVEFECEYILV